MFVFGYTVYLIVDKIYGTLVLVDHCVCLLFVVVCFKFWLMIHTLKKTKNYEKSGKRGSHHISIALFLIYILCLFGLAEVVARLHQWPNAESCTYTYIISFIVFISIKFLNYTFFLQRAKVSNSTGIMESYVKPVTLNRTIPILMAIFYVASIAFLFYFPLYGKGVKSPHTGRKLCIWNENSLNKVAVALFCIFLILLDIISAIFFFLLFGKPLRHITKNTSARFVLNKIICGFDLLVWSDSVFYASVL